MRIGLVCPYSLDVPGGVQNHVSGLAQALLARGHEVGVLAPGERRPGMPPHVETVGRAVPIAYNGSVARLAFGPRAAARTRRWLRAGRYDVVHVHEPLAPSVSLLALRAAEAPVVATFHAAYPPSLAKDSAAALLRASMGRITAQIAVSQAAKDSVASSLRAHAVVIPNGIFCAPFEQALPRPEWRGTGSTVAFLGRIGEPRKGLSVLLAAVPALLEGHPEARVLVAGRGDRRAFPVPARMRERVTFLGEVSDEDRARLLASAAVFVAPQTHGESFGLVLVEAMAAGAAVVASDLPAFRTVLAGGRFGRLFPPGDPAALAVAVAALLDDAALRRELAGRAQVEAGRYDWGVLTPEVEAHYRSVVAASSEPA